jgi:hypothetical protein
MATLDILTARVPPALYKIDVPLDPGELPQRAIYGFPEFQNWLDQTLPQLAPGRLRAAETPKEQVDFRLYQWVTGKDILYSRMLNDLMPGRDEVWELKTTDTRIFGWMYKPCVFIAVFGDYADLYKGGANARASYTASRRRVVTARRRIDLDEPKFVTGTFDDLIRV